MVQSNSGSNRIKWRTDWDKQTLILNFEKRNWQKAQDGEDWNFYWTIPQTIKSKNFNPHLLRDNQIINHFPNHDQLTRKDLMVKNIRQYIQGLVREKNPLAEKDGEGKFQHLDFIPTTYILPQSYSSFEQEFRKCPDQVWIMKPAGRAQGSGIELITDLDQMKRWEMDKSAFNSQAQVKESHVISKYIMNPLLIGGRKFDLRIYVLVTCYKPLKAYLYAQGFGRFCVEKYSHKVSDLKNKSKHISNAAIAKQNVNYNEKHGSKWNIQAIRFFLEQTHGKTATDSCFDKINDIIYISLKSVQGQVTNSKHSFELYGYDVMIDSDLKPWLIEVNASPSLAPTTEPDRILKMGLINDTLDVVMPPEWFNEDSKKGTNLCTSAKVGQYNLIIDEGSSSQGEEKKKDKKLWH